MTAKQELRAFLKERRGQIPPSQKKELDRAIVRHILASDVYRNADTILLFAPMEGEIDLLPLARQARHDGKAIAFPRCDVESTTMQFYLLLPDARLRAGAYGIPEPPEDAPMCILSERSLCLLPALSFDPTGRRIGYGKGYYDRFLATFPGIAAGVIHRRMMLKEIPSEPHDLPVSFLFTEDGMRSCKDETALTAPQQVPDTSIKDEPDRKPEAGGVLEKLRRSVRQFGNACRCVWADKTGVYPLHAPPCLVLSCFVLLLLSRLVDTHLTTRENEYAVVILLQLLIFALPAVIYCKLRGERFTGRLRLRPPRPEQIWFLLCLLVVMITGGMLLSILTGGIRSLGGGFTLYDTFVAHADTSPLQILYVILAYGLLPAFCEELIFRALLCAEYERFGPAIAILNSALFFALLHFSFPHFLCYLFLGAVLACALFATRSLWSAFLLHLGYNLFCIFGQPYLSSFYVHAGSNEIFLFCLITLFLLFSAFALGEARKIYHRYARTDLPTPRGSGTLPRELPSRLAKSLFTPTVLPCIAIFLLMAILDLVL